MLQKATFFCVNAASVSALFQLESCRLADHAALGA
jgi:hypothetical protein